MAAQNCRGSLAAALDVRDIGKLEHATAADQRGVRDLLQTIERPVDTNESLRPIDVDRSGRRDGALTPQRVDDFTGTYARRREPFIRKIDENPFGTLARYVDLRYLFHVQQSLTQRFGFARRFLRLHSAGIHAIDRKTHIGIFVVDEGTERARRQLMRRERVAAKLLHDYPSLNVLINNAGIMPFDDAAVYSATKASLHSCTLSQRFMLRETNVAVQEIAPPWVDMDLVKKSGDPRAIFIERTMAGLATEAEEVIVDEVRAIRDNPGSGEHKLINDFNASLIANPIPA